MWAPPTPISSSPLKSCSFLGGFEANLSDHRQPSNQEPGSITHKNNHLTTLLPISHIWYTLLHECSGHQQERLDLGSGKSWKERGEGRTAKPEELFQKLNVGQGLGNLWNSYFCSVLISSTPRSWELCLATKHVLVTLGKSLFPIRSITQPIWIQLASTKLSQAA